MSHGCAGVSTNFPGEREKKRMNENLGERSEEGERD